MSMTNAARAWRDHKIVSPSAQRQTDIEFAVCFDFVSWMRSEGADGWWASTEIDELLESYCDRRGLTPPPRDRARKLMTRIPGVLRERRRLTGPALERLARVTGLTRATVYWIPPSRPVPGPWTVQARAAAGA